METKTIVTGRFIGLAAIAALVLALALAMTPQPVPAFADEGDSSSASTASEPSASASATEAIPDEESQAAEEPSAASSLPILGGLPMMGNDYVWFGRDLELSKGVIENDLIAAGQIIDLKDCAVAGSIRAAAQDVLIRNSSAAENITVAGETVAIEGGTANSVAAVGKAVTFGGSCNELTAYAEKVFIDGTVEGDVEVGATTVEVGTNARIKGTLHVTASSDPVMQRGAEVGDVEFVRSESGSVSSADVESAVSGLATSLLIMMAIVGVISTLLIAVLAEWLFKRHTAAAANMIRTRTGATIGTGIIGALVAPLAIIVLFFLVITIPVAGALTLALLAMSCVAGGFAGASLFKLAFPRLGRYKCALAGGAIVGVASAIPFLGSLVSAAAFMYLLGYVLQSIFLGMHDRMPAAPAGTPVAAPIPPSYPAAAPAAAPIPQSYPAAASPEPPVPVAPTASETPATPTGNPPVPPS